MLAPTTVVNILVAKLRAIPDLVATVDGRQDRIEAYTGVGDLAKRIEQLPEPALLVVHQSTIPMMDGSREVWMHQIGITVRTPNDPSAIFKAIANKPPVGFNKKIWETNLDRRLMPVGNFQIFRRQLQLDAGVYLDYYELLFNFPENGDQNDE